MTAVPCLPVDKLSKLIPLLASDQDGEVVSAARAIGRALAAASCDFHDVVKALSTPRPTHRERGRADMARAGAFYETTPHGRSHFEEAMGAFHKAASEFKAAATRRSADAPEIKRLAPQMLGGGKLSARDAKFVRAMKLAADGNPAFVMSAAQHQEWNGIVRRAL